MKREITKLEKVLIEKGYKLECKTYKGKDRDRVDSYVYTREFNFSAPTLVYVSSFTFVVLLNAKRNRIVSLYCKNDLSKVGEVLDEKILSIILLYLRLEKTSIIFDDEKDKDEISDDEVIQVAEEIGAEDE